MSKRSLLCLTAVFSLLLSGCSASGSIFANYREIEQLQLVQTLGLDGDDRELTLTVATGKPLDGSKPTVISRTARGLVQAITGIQDYSASEQIFFPHVQYILLGEDYAKNGLRDILDYVERDVRLRTGTELFVLRAATARELMTGTGDEQYTVTAILDSVRRDVNYRGDSHVFTLRETARSLGENGAALICAVRAVNIEGSVFLTEPGLTAVPDGYGVLKDGKLAGYISARNAEGASLLLDTLGTAVISLNDSAGDTVTLETTGSSASLRPIWTAEGKLDHIEVKAGLRAAVSEPDSRQKMLESREYTRLLEEALAGDMEKRVLSVLDTSSRLDADFLGLGSTLNRDNWRNYAALPEDWLRSAEFRVTVEAEIDRSYDLGDPAETEGRDT